MIKIILTVSVNSLDLLENTLKCKTEKKINTFVSHEICHKQYNLI